MLSDAMRRIAPDAASRGASQATSRHVAVEPGRDDVQLLTFD